MSRLLVGAALIGIACLQVRAAAAQEEPAPAPAPAPPPVGIVQTQHVDTVVVAEPGSRVAVHNAEASPYAPDPARKGAIIASSIGWGLGALVLGGGYLGTHGSETCTYATGSGASQCTHNGATDWLVAYDLDMAIVPSIPRWVVGDVSGALIFTGLRGASVAAASLVQWSDDAFGPVVLGFLVPVTLGVVDLVFTPHRESLQRDDAPRTASATGGLHLLSLAPAPVTGPDRRVDGGSLHLTASF
jgi:hypothetical protein